MTSFEFYASDVTNQPGSFAGSNIAAEKTAFPGGARLSAAGNYLVYTTNTGDIQIIDASNPGPVGNISASLPRTTQVVDYVQHKGREARADGPVGPDEPLQLSDGIFA